MKLTRRNFVKTTAASAVILPFNSMIANDLIKNQIPATQKQKICAFSKLFQFLDFDQMADVFASAGLDGIDLTVRSGGHVEPVNVRADLPRAVKAARKSGIEVYMMTTDVIDPDNKLNIDLLKIAADHGVKYYRFGYLNYDLSRPIFENMDNASRIFEKFAILNEKTGIHGAYQNHHQKPRIGSPGWDLWYILKDVNPDWVSCQFDIWHGVIEGYSTWWHTLMVLQPYIKTICIKDFNWTVGRNGKLRPEAVPLGEGQIDFNAYFQLLSKLDFKGDISLHVEYPVLSTEENDLPISRKMEKAKQVLISDLNRMRAYMKGAGYTL